MINLAIYQREHMKEMEAARKESDRKNAALTEQPRKSNEALSALTMQMSKLMGQFKEERKETAKL